MSDTKSNNYRLECPFCKENFLTKTFSTHLIDKHLSEIFVNKSNKSELDQACSRKEGSWFSPMEIKIKDKILFYVPCCKKFYAKKAMGDKHSSDKQCRDSFLKNVKELSEKITPITINNTHSGTGDNITIVNNTYNLVDLSGNVIRTIKYLNQVIDRKNLDTAYDKKLIAKMKKKLQENDIESVSDVSSVETCYDSDDESDTKAMRYDISKERPDIYQKLSKIGFDVSREGLDLRTKEDHDMDAQEKKKLIIDDLEIKIEQCDEYISELTDRIKIELVKREKEKYQEELKELRGK